LDGGVKHVGTRQHASPHPPPPSPPQKLKFSKYAAVWRHFHTKCMVIIIIMPGDIDILPFRTQQHLLMDDLMHPLTIAQSIFSSIVMHNEYNTHK